MSELMMPNNDPIRAAQRKAKAQRRVGHDAVCASCGESRPAALIAGSKPMTCAKCKRTKEGKAVTDKHHVAGKANSPVTIPVPVNEHRAILSVAQQGWPKDTLENPEGDPLLAAAARLRGSSDTITYLVQEFLLVIAVLLEFLSEFLNGKLGPQWWVGTRLEHFAKGRSL